ncbi:MAG: hypothetical protein WCX83_04435 [Candidatus Cloacimonas sp.]|jgi:hypothetical protein|nr:hypothetical protein [Candidatus Cloacimonadota bacterium]
MKLTPQEVKIQERLKPGVVTLDGFLGKDKRHYNEIIAEDLEVLKGLAKTKEEIADRLDYLTKKALPYDEDGVVIDEIYDLQYVTARGRIISPFMDRTFWPKGIITLKNLQNGVEIRWTPLSIHLIRRYGFFQGKGATFRTEPSDLIKAIF